MLMLNLILSMKWGLRLTGLICFYINLQGTTRPTHYHVLLDEVGFSPDDLQELVHSLSYV